MTDDEQVIQAIERLGGRHRGVNEASILYACSNIRNINAVMKHLTDAKLLQRVGSYAVQLAEAPTPSAQKPDESRCEGRTRTVNEPQLEQEADQTAPSKPSKQVRQRTPVGAVRVHRDASATVPDPNTQDVARTRTELTVSALKIRKLAYKALGQAYVDRVRGLGARIVDRLEVEGPQMNLRTLERALHANRFAEWTEALTLLIARNAIVIAGGSITLVDGLAGAKLPDPYRQEAVKKRRRPRRRTAWFQEMLRRSEELGVPIGEVIRAGPARQ